MCCAKSVIDKAGTVLRKPRSKIEVVFGFADMKSKVFQKVNFPRLEILRDINSIIRNAIVGKLDGHFKVIA